MCATCEAVSGKSQKEALDIISAAVGTGGINRHLSKLMDKVLGTSVEAEVDVVAEKRAFKTMQHLKQDFSPSKAKEEAQLAMGQKVNVKE